MKKVSGSITVFVVALSLGMCTGVSAADQDQWQEVASLSVPMIQEAAVTRNVAEWIDAKVAADTVIGREELLKTLSANAANNAETTFKSYIADPVPHEIKILDGNSTHWQGFSAYLIFEAEPATFQAIVADYQSIPLAQVKAQAKGWFPENITTNPNMLCFYKKDDFNNIYYLFWDAKGQRVFFKGLENS